MKSLSLCLLAAAVVFAPAADAAADDWFVRVGAHVVDPKSDNGRLAGGALGVDINSNARPTLAVGRFLNDRWAIELLAAAPFRHDVAVNGVRAANFKHLPPTLGAQYYFRPGTRFRPFLGAGLNYTVTFSEKAVGPLADTRVRIGNSFGLAAQAGFVAQLTDSMHLVADVRWIDIDASVSVDGSRVGRVAVDPLVYGVYLGWTF